MTASRPDVLAPEPGEPDGDSARPSDSDRVLISTSEAARLLGISRSALYMRIFRHQVGGIVRTGRRVQFHRARLLAWLDRKVSR